MKTRNQSALSNRTRLESVGENDLFFKKPLERLKK